MKYIFHVNLIVAICCMFEIWLFQSSEMFKVIPILIPILILASLTNLAVYILDLVKNTNKKKEAKTNEKI